MVAQLIYDIVSPFIKWDVWPAMGAHSYLEVDKEKVFFGSLLV